MHLGPYVGGLLRHEFGRGILQQMGATHDNFVVAVVPAGPEIATKKYIRVKRAHAN